MNETCGASAPLIPPIYTFDLQLKDRKTYAILRHVAGSISLIASSILVWSVLRSHIRLSSTFNRLLFGLCVADIMSSCAYMLSTVMIPKEVDYFYWNARGNMLTCNLQGFLHVMGFSASLYNCSICIYYLAIVKYNKSDMFIRDKIEPWLHGVSILFPLAGAIIGVTMKAMNPWGSICTLKRYNPPHCAYCEDGQVRDEAGFNIPCGRGTHATLLLDVFILSIIIISPIIMTVTLSIMYQTVGKNVRNMRSYGRGSLDISTTLEGVSSRWDMSQYCLSCRRTTEGSNGRRSNQCRSMQKILYRTIAYSLGWLLTYVFFLTHRIIKLRGFKIPTYIFFPDAFLCPLQGAFNFIIYTYPKVTKSKNGDLTWFEAFVKALMSKGEERGDTLRQTPFNDSRQSASNRRPSAVQSIKVKVRRLSAGVATLLAPSSKIKNDLELELEDGISNNDSIVDFPIMLGDTKQSISRAKFGVCNNEIDDKDADAADADAEADIDIAINIDADIDADADDAKSFKI